MSNNKTEIMDKMKLKQLFTNNSDCYADTWEEGGNQNGEDATMIEGEVIPAMTQEKFIEVVSELLTTTPQITDDEIQEMAEAEYSTSDIVPCQPNATQYLNFQMRQQAAYIKGIKDILKLKK